MSERLIYESKKSKVYRLDDNEWGRPVVMKVLNYEFPTPQDISQFYNEYEIISSVRLDGIRNALRKGKDKNRHVLYLEWVDGEPLHVAFRGKQNDIIDFLHLAVAMADALGQIHRHNIIHKDISPFNMVVDLQERKVRIIDFGISTNLDIKQHYLGNPERLEGTLTYNSPEQTGRMNRVVDYRTDLYSLGVTMYEMLAGRPPFASKDAMELVHAHMAHIPRPLHEVNSHVPEQVSAIIARLLAKNAEDRYQSAHGLRADLERCLNEFAATGAIAPFELAQRDFSGKFQIPQKLYGREAETATLLSAFDRCADGGRELVLVAGYSGTGKSVLVHEVHRPITAKRGYFISGKFDQFQRSVPYYAILEAFKELVNMFLTENEDKLDRLRNEIQKALGEEGRVLTNVLPNLEHIIGVQPAIPEVGGSEAQNRFDYLFRRFVGAISTHEHPLVVFIDDLQWADSASLHLLHTLMTDTAGGHLLCIGAYRDNEVSPTHPAMVTVDRIQQEAHNVRTVSIGNLSKQDVNDLITDALHVSEEEAFVLTRLVYAKTKGNAFFVTQFLKSIYEEKLLVFDHAALRWIWDMDRVSEKNITDNVVELMTGKILRLPPATQEVLKAGACIGSSFPYDMLSIVVQKDEEELRQTLFSALKEGLIVPQGETKVRFSHDRIQQAVYSLIPADRKSEVHLNIGRLLLRDIPADKREERLFDMVNQLNSGLGLITDGKEKEQLAQLNLQAGRRAKQNSAFQPSFEYLSTGIGLLGPDRWTAQYDLCLPLHSEACEAAYLNGEFGHMENLFQEIITHAQTILEKVKPCEIRILAFKAQNKLIEAIRTGLEVLEQLGEKFPKNPNMLHVAGGLMGTLWSLRNKDSDHLMNLPVMVDQEKIAAMRIIADITSSVYWGMPNLLPLIVFRMVGLSLRYGNTAVSCFAYGSFGVINCGVLGFMKKGNEYGELSLKLLDKLNAKEWKAQIYVSPYALTFHWRNHVRTTLRPLQESFQIGMETGLIEFACVNTNIYCIHSLLCGRPLGRVEEETHAYSRSYHQFRQETNFNYNEVYRQAMLNFMGRAADPVVLVGDAYDETVMLRQNAERNDKTGTFFIHFLKSMLALHFRQAEMALQQAREAERLLDAVLAKFEIPNLHYYHALAALALADDRNPDRGKLIAKARKCQGILRKWAKDAPMNFAHKADLIEAELLRVKGRHNEARTWYDRAIAGASTHEFLHEEALGYELTGRFYLDQDLRDLAEYYLKAAYNAYREWGASAKLRHLEQNFPKYVSGVMRSEQSLTGSTSVDVSSSMVHSSVLDISTVIKASTTISGEVVLPRLLGLLMQVVIENAGAQRGFLLLDKDGELLVEARVEGDGSTEILSHRPMDGSNLLARSVVAFVRRTHEHVVIQDATRDPRYKGDPFITEMRPQSIMCLPIINQGKFIGILYLENNLATGAFTQERVNLLTLLSGQIAVSIDNAILYHNLEQKVQERTVELAAEKKKSDDLLYNILPAETAEEIKQKGFAEVRQFERATILFTDFKGFTSLAEKVTPRDLVRDLNECFSAFDQIVEKYRIEKIKTIGDSYMAAGGIPTPNSTHATDVVQAALEMRDFIAEGIERKKAAGLPYFEVRIGINTGPVIAGIVGLKKFQYDIWGDAVNTASRMESSGAVGKVNASESTYALIHDRFNCEYRGEIEAKGKGKVKMYFIER
jgi:predicted ATPase/class 3 adenylate cyclase